MPNVLCILQLIIIAAFATWLVLLWLTARDEWKPLSQVAQLLKLLIAHSSKTLRSNYTPRGRTHSAVVINNLKANQSTSVDPKQDVDGWRRKWFNLKSQSAFMRRALVLCLFFMILWPVKVVWVSHNLRCFLSVRHTASIPHFLRFRLSYIL